MEDVVYAWFSTAAATSAAGATSAEARDERGQAGMGGGQIADEQWSVYLASKAAALRSELEQAPTPSRTPRPHPHH